jgi:hypothetical protein
LLYKGTAWLGTIILPPNYFVQNMIDKGTLFPNNYHDKLTSTDISFKTKLQLIPTASRLTLTMFPRFLALSPDCYQVQYRDPSNLTGDFTEAENYLFIMNDGKWKYEAYAAEKQKGRKRLCFTYYQ